MKILSRTTAPRYQRDLITSYLLVSKRTCDSDDLTTTLVEMQPGGFQRVHSHKPEQMYYILEGSGLMTIDNEDKQITGGDCIFIPSNSEHGLKNCGDGVLRYLSAASPSFSLEESLELWPLKSRADS